MLALAVSALLVFSALTTSSRAYAAIVATVNLGTASSYSVLGGQAVTNTGPTVLEDSLGVSPGSAVSGFPPGIVNGARQQGNAAAAQAQRDVTVAYNNAAGRPSNAAIAANLGGRTLVGGVYTASSSAQLTGPLTLDGENNRNSASSFRSARRSPPPAPAVST